ncbi:maleylpyruvate isomerase family mycothiol-dependent enzyme [Brachybacterium sp. NPDC056505]|uniref:maleylpyruvate isomerase family mycothiol-dependent enzyme n=1 Tax=Brachybacterium sp. NPDC056505 TaxID=3345843 RepID=UPI00366F0A29
MSDLPQLLRAERSRLVELLTELDTDDWEHSTLCPSWSVHEIVAHLAAAASTPTPIWLLTMIRSRFDTDRHNDRLLRRHLENGPAAAIRSFQATISTTNAPFGALEAALGEVVVHGQDIARPLGLPLDPSPEALRTVAEFFARKDFAVNSATLVKGLQLCSTDLDLRLGDGPAVCGTALDLVLTMAGRAQAADCLEGEGAVLLRERLGALA